MASRRSSKQLISPDKFENLLRKTPGHLFWKDINGVYKECNQMQADSLGLSSPKDLIGKTDFDILPKKDAQQLRINDETVMRTKEARVFEEVAVLKNGKKGTFLSRKEPWFNDQKEVIGIIGTALDISDIKEEHDKTKLTLDSIIDNVPGHIYWKDRKGVILGCNHEQAKAIGLTSRHQIKGLTDHEVLPKKLADEVTAIDQKVMASGRPHTVEEVLEEPDGQMSIWLSKKVPLYDNAEQVIGVLGISIDITAQKEAEKLEKEKELLQDRAETAKLLAASIAHELRTPLRSVRSASETITKQFDKLLEGYMLAKEYGLSVSHIHPLELENMKELGKDLQHEVDHMLNVIGNLLVHTNLTKVNVDKFEIVSIKEVIQSAMRHYKEDTDYSLVHQEGNDFKFLGDKLLIELVFLNLITNAFYQIKAAGKGDITIKTYHGDDAHNYVEFKDTASGIPAEDLPHIFKRFYSKTPGNTGIGLAFSKLVMQSMKGDIRCESEHGQYTLFILNFPELKKERQV